MARGIEEIIAHYKSLFALGIPMTVSTQLVRTVEANDVALVTTRWTLEGVDPEGNRGSVEKIANLVFGRSNACEWKLLIDNPFGPELVTAEGA